MACLLTHSLGLPVDLVVGVGLLFLGLHLLFLLVLLRLDLGFLVALDLVLLLDVCVFLGAVEGVLEEVFACLRLGVVRVGRTAGVALRFEGGLFSLAFNKIGQLGVLAVFADDVLLDILVKFGQSLAIIDVTTDGAVSFQRRTEF